MISSKNPDSTQVTTNKWHNSMQLEHAECLYPYRNPLLPYSPLNKNELSLHPPIILLVEQPFPPSKITYDIHAPHHCKSHELTKGHRNTKRHQLQTRKRILQYPSQTAHPLYLRLCRTYLVVHPFKLHKKGHRTITGCLATTIT